jgi:hypothetical protein
LCLTGRIYFVFPQPASIGLVGQYFLLSPTNPHFTAQLQGFHHSDI